MIARQNDPAVISQQMIRDAVDEEAKAHQAPDIDYSQFPKQPIDSATVLHLSFKSKHHHILRLLQRWLTNTEIYQIDNLVCLPNLVQLRLDNNRITRIENLQHLVGLKWLGVFVAHRIGCLRCSRDKTWYRSFLQSNRKD